VLAAILIRVNAWADVFASIATLGYLTVTGAEGWEKLLVLCLLALVTVKHFDGLRTNPGIGGWLLRWVQSIRRDTPTGV
jgi:hypothetical protein